MEHLNHELYESARKRIKQKRNLFVHFVLFFVGSIFLLVIEKLLNVGITYPNWSYWTILAWAFLFILHFVNVFITKRFMNKQWEREEIDKLVAKQKRRIDELQKKVEEQYKTEELSSGENTSSE
ncbi:MAG TPA: 2TM domain-containing protein [Flavobacteriaceae bacterium]|nr:2TM domain-containing protein [Flavobacteriaceae bacterium]